MIGLGLGIQCRSRGVAAAPTLVVSDTFNRADNVALGNAETGQVWEVITGVGHSIISNQAGPPSTSSCLTAVNAGISNARTQVVVNVLGGSSAIVFRLSDSANYIRAVIPNASTVQITEVGGAGLIATFNPTISLGDTFAIEATGSTINVYQNSVLIGTVNSSFNTTAIKYGIFNQASAAGRWDDFKVYTT